MIIRRMASHQLIRTLRPLHPTKRKRKYSEQDALASISLVIGGGWRVIAVPIYCSQKVDARLFVTILLSITDTRISHTRAHNDTRPAYL